MGRFVWEDAREQARQVLDDAWDQTLPVDIDSISRASGVIPYLVDLPDSKSGMLIKRRDKKSARSYIARNDPEVRRRFTCAHELGHYRERMMADDSEYGFEDEFFDRKNVRRSNYFPHEFFADEFAGAVLMPEVKINEFKELGMTPEQMAEKFNVSVSAVRHRLAALKNHPTPKNRRMNNGE